MSRAKPFSERAGFSSPRTVIQVDSLDDATRTALWNCFYSDFLSEFTRQNYFFTKYEFGQSYARFWCDFLRQPIDELDHNSYRAQEHLHEFFFSSPWYQVFDFLEFIVGNYAYPDTCEEFAAAANGVLQDELAGYRIVGGLFTRITSEEEIHAIEAALQSTDPLEPVQLHLRDALAKLSDRKNPDFRNSVKEAISAVEALSRIISGQPRATLGDALAAIEKQGNIQIHGALKSGFSSIYGWTSDAQGIRHALLEEPDLGFEDAKFMLVACSAFVSYLVAKCAAAGLDLRSRS